MYSQMPYLKYLLLFALIIISGCDVLVASKESVDTISQKMENSKKIQDNRIKTLEDLLAAQDSIVQNIVKDNKDVNKKLGDLQEQINNQILNYKMQQKLQNEFIANQDLIKSNIEQDLLVKTTNEDYNFAVDMLSLGRLNEAILSLKLVVDNKQAEQNLCDNARYLMASVYMLQKDYSNASRIFLNTYENNKNGRRAFDSLMKLSLSLSKNNDSKGACSVLEDLHQKLSTDFKSIEKGKVNQFYDHAKALGCKVVK